MSKIQLAQSWPHSLTNAPPRQSNTQRLEEAHAIKEASDLGARSGGTAFLSNCAAVTWHLRDDRLEARNQHSHADAQDVTRGSYAQCIRGVGRRRHNHFLEERERGVKRRSRLRRYDSVLASVVAIECCTPYGATCGHFRP